MSISPEQLALQHIQAVCQGHADALSEALQDMQLRALGADDYTHLNKDDRRLLDQFAYRYTRLQDDMGARLMPSVLKAMAMANIFKCFRTLSGVDTRVLAV